MRARANPEDTYTPSARWRDSPAVCLAAAMTCGLAFVGYGATRLLAFPLLADDVSNGLEPRGVLSTTAESVEVAVCEQVRCSTGRGPVEGGRHSHRRATCGRVGRPSLT